MERTKRTYTKRHHGPATIEEARHMARIKAAHAAPLWGMVPKQLSLMCLRGEVQGAVKIGRNYFVTPDGMDAIFSSSNAKSQRGRRFRR